LFAAQAGAAKIGRAVSGVLEGGESGTRSQQEATVVTPFDLHYKFNRVAIRQPNQALTCELIDSTVLRREANVEIIVNTRGQIVIPAAVRRKLKIKPGTRITIEVDEARQRLILTPITSMTSITPEYVHSLRGKHQIRGALQALMADRQRERELQ
jgi:AbrB family looped-hinge helix DNA binding protein